MATVMDLMRERQASQPTGRMPTMAKEQNSQDQEQRGAPYGYKADGTPRKRPGRRPGEVSKERLIKDVSLIRSLSADDLEISDIEAQQAATKQTGATGLERDELQKAVDSQVQEALAEWEDRGMPADIPGQRIVRFMPAESPEAAEELRRKLESSRKLYRRTVDPGFTLRTFAVSRHKSGAYLLPYSVAINSTE